MKENKMGVMPVNRLLITMSVPMVISMLVQALYNIVDSMYVAQISENALTAVSLAFPYQNLMIAVATGTGVGVNALLSRSLGERNKELVNKTACTCIFLAGASWIVFALLGLGFSRTFFAMQTDVTEIVNGGESYLLICSILSIGLFIQIAFEKLLSSTGRTVLTMLTQGAGAIINIVLDPILIFGMFGMPKMGIAGAAAATVVGQIIGAFLGIWLNHRFNHEIHVSFRSFRPEFKVIKAVYSVGIPSILMASIGSVMTFGMNKILIGFSTTAAAVFGVYFKLQSFVFMPIFGMNNGLVPIVAYNFGARKPERIVKTVKLSMMYATGMMVLGFAAFQLFPQNLLSIFNASDTMLAIGIPALKIISFHFLIAGVSIICSSTFQALGHGVLSLEMSLIRQLIVLLPCAFLFAQTGVLDLVWLAFPIAELVAVVLGILFMVRIFRAQIRPLKEEQLVLEME